MYFSQGKAQSGQQSFSDLRQSVTQRPTSSKQKNSFNFNIYFSQIHPQSSKGVSSTSLYQLDGMNSLAANDSLHRNGSQSSSNKSASSYLIPQKPQNSQSTSPSTKMHHTFHRFKKTPNKNNITSASNLNSSSSSNTYQNNLSSISRNVSRVQLVGFSEDPEFQHMKATSEKIVAANSGLLQVNTDEIATEVEYDLRIKQLKRSSSAFLPAYKAFKTNSSSLSLHTQPLTLAAAQQIQNPSISTRRPFYFLTDKNEPLFSLKQLEEKFTMKQKAKEIIEQSEEDKSSSISQHKQLLLRTALFNESHAEFRVSKPVKASNSNNLSSNSLVSKLFMNYTPDNLKEKKFVFLTIKTSSKGRDSISKIDSQIDDPFFKPDSLNDESSSLYQSGEPFKLTIELYTKIAPKACENFLKLCEGYVNSEGNFLTFRNTSAVRLKKNGFIQLGFAKPGVSIYPSGYFEDESFAVTHDFPGILGCCNRGTPHSNSGQFYITLGEMKSFDKKMVAFGRVISGFKHLEKINKILPSSSFSQIPSFNITICDSGIAQSRPSTNQSRVSTNSSSSAFRSPTSHSKLIDQLEHDKTKEEEYKVVRPDIFFYKGEKANLSQTFESYVIGEADKHKDVANVEYITLMMGLQSIALQCSGILQQSYQFKTIEEIRAAMKQIFVSILSECQSVALLYDIIDDEVFIESNTGKYVVAFTSLDVNNLADLNSCGSLFLIFRKTTTSFRPAKRADLLQSGETISGAGYFFYGQATQIVFQTGFRLNGFTYDPENNLFVLTHPRIKAPKRSGIISCDESKLILADENMTKFIKRKKHAKETYVSRVVGSVVADFHRTMLYGGILIFPLKEINIYEAFVLSYLIDKAWDRSSCGQEGQILVKKPIDCTEQVQLYLGYSSEVLEIDNLYLQIRRKNSLNIPELSSQQTIKSSFKIPKSQINSPRSKPI